ncbi:amidoligase family protein [Oleidesulfovibrio sp.]|uniref:amidoligase family protein n=1 Tax=Oleidesulfovibrio sp. TaxID=2909707 RepID=UPI003A84CBB4
MPDRVRFAMPPIMHNAAGEIRKVGFELEFTGVQLLDVAQDVADIFGGKAERQSNYIYKVSNTRFGDFTLEVDASQLKSEKYKDLLSELGFDLDIETLNSLDSLLLKIASLAVPFELVMPPVPLTELQELSCLESILRRRAARGTRDSLLYAFAMQFNPELPSFEPAVILDHMRAFFVLQHWLELEMDIDISRRLSPFIDSFPEAYIRKVLKADYTPDLRQLIDDYLQYNPTRNRPLDMTCLFAHLDYDRVISKVEEPHLVKPRPTFHFRMPDCRIDEPSWSMALEWNRWVNVEQLAADKTELRKVCDAYLATPPSIGSILQELSDWIAS